VQDVSAFQENLSQLRHAQKSSSGAPAYSRFVNRPLGRLLAAGARVLGLTPTQVTLLSGATTLAGIVVLAVLPPHLATALLVTGLLVLGYALDSADGQLARLTRTGSLAGEWLDHFFDALKAVALHAAVLVCWFRYFDVREGWYLVPLVFATVSSGFFFGVVGADLLRRIAGQGAPTAAPRAVRSSPLYALAVLPADYGFLCIAFLLLWIPDAFVVLYTALAAINAVVLALSAVRWYRSIRALDARTA